MDDIKKTKMEESTKGSFSFWGLLKALFIAFLIVQFLPDAFSTAKNALTEALDTRPQVGCIDIVGPITDSQRGIALLKKYNEDSAIKAILIRINSPGGLPGSAQALYYEINKIRENKPVAVYVENCCASAAYHIAAAADCIVTTPAALVGSIGTYMEIANIKGLLDDWKVRMNYVQSGKFKTMGSITKELNDEERNLLQMVSDDSYQQFIGEVALSRTLDVAKHQEWADGKVFTGQQAHALGLVDELGGQQTALDYLKKILKSEVDLKLVTQKVPFNFLNMLGGEDSLDMGESGAGTVLGKAFGQFVKASALAL